MTERLTVDLPTASAMLGISRNTGYALAREGRFPCPVIRAGRRLLVSRIALAQLLGQDDRPAVEDGAVSDEHLGGDRRGGTG